jgi:pantoate--beta-alanine ligase
MSSRNSYLSDDQRHQALGLFKALESAKEMISAGEVSAIIIKQKLKSILEEGKDVRVDYVEVVDTDTLEPSDEVQDNTLIAVAAYVGDARLIDNIVIKGAK